MEVLVHEPGKTPKQAPKRIIVSDLPQSQHVAARAVIPRPPCIYARGPFYSLKAHSSKSQVVFLALTDSDLDLIVLQATHQLSPFALHAAVLC